MIQRRPNGSKNSAKRELRLEGYREKGSLRNLAEFAGLRIVG